MKKIICLYLQSHLASLLKSHSSVQGFSGLTREVKWVCEILFPVSATGTDRMRCVNPKDTEERPGEHTRSVDQQVCREERGRACWATSCQSDNLLFLSAKNNPQCCCPRATPVWPYVTLKARLSTSLHSLHRIHLDFIEDFMMNLGDRVESYMTYPIGFAYPPKKPPLDIRLSF